jgi:tetratricopeptide (TPR) repeat protein
VKDNWKKGMLDVLHCNYNFVELWGGSETMFENVEQWVGAGAAYEFTHSYAHVRGIGKVDYADTRAAVNVEFGDKPLVEAMVFAPTDTLTAEWDGKVVGAGPCGPGKPVTFALPAGTTGGTLTLKAGATECLRQAFPLPMTPNLDAYDRIMRSYKERDKNPAFGEMFADMPEMGQSYRSSINKYPDGSVGRGRLLYRDGQLDAAVTCLRKATEATPDDGEAWHLLGATLLEKAKTDQDKLDASAALQKAIDAKTPYPASHYFLALLAIERRDNDAANQSLAMLAKADPKHFEGALLKAWINADLAEARVLEAADAADPRVVAVLAHCGAPVAKEDLAAILKQEPGAKQRLDEFLAATEGCYLPPARLGR